MQQVRRVEVGQLQDHLGHAVDRHGVELPVEIGAAPIRTRPQSVRQQIAWVEPAGLTVA